MIEAEGLLGLSAVLGLSVGFALPKHALSCKTSIWEMFGRKRCFISALQGTENRTTMSKMQVGNRT